MRKNKNTSKIVLAILVACIATTISYSAFKNMNNEMQQQQKLIEVMQNSSADNQKGTFAYAVVVKDLKAGELVADGDVDFRQFDNINTDAFENRSDVINKILLKDISNGEVFTGSHIAKISSDDVTLKDGYRALTLPADNFQGKSAKMTIGTAVDIYSAASGDNWILENVKIIGFEGASSAGATTAATGIKDATAITFEVNSSDISDFISNISKSKLVLVVRNSQDKKVFRKPTKYSDSSEYGGSVSSLPNLPASVPITNMSGLPEPIGPVVQPSSVELIEANVKSKVTFD